MKPTPLREKAALLAGAALVLANRAALRARLTRRTDGWRRAAGLMLRGEGATFVLSAFGLDAWSGGSRPEPTDDASTRARAALRLGEFLARESGLHLRVTKGTAEDRVEPAGGPSYTLRIDPALDGPARFVRPDDWSGDARLTGAGVRPAEALMNIVCRADHGGTVDVWVRTNHVGADGVPIQEMLTRLEAEWGGWQRVRFPTPAEFAPFSGPRPCAGRAGLAEVQAFLDFAPLLAWRKQENARLPEPMTVAAALKWRLAQRAEFEGLHMGSTVEVGAVQGLERGVGVVVVKPAAYFGRADGLARYVRDFNRQIGSTRARASDRCRTLDAAAKIPAGLATTLLTRALEQGRAAFGSMGLTILKDARVFGAPIADVGHADGFIALGGLDLPTEGGGKVGCVMVKGPAARIADYPRLIQDAIAPR